jgi:hypothetical protein
MTDITSTAAAATSATSAEISTIDDLGIASDFARPNLDELDVDQSTNATTRLTDKDNTENKEKKTSKEKTKFNLAIIVAAALVFIVVIAWFETIRIWLEFAFNASTEILFRKALGDTVYAASATVIAVILIWLLTKFFIN